MPLALSSLKIQRGTRCRAHAAHVPHHDHTRSFHRLQRGPDSKRSSLLKASDFEPGEVVRTQGDVDAFFRQLEEERGEVLGTLATSLTTPGMPYDACDDDEARALVDTVLDVLQTLKVKRDMTFNEVRLTLSIEDPSEKRRRQEMGIEDESGVSRDEIAAALYEIEQGLVPADGVVLEQLAREMVNWPDLDADSDAMPGEGAPMASDYAASTPGSVRVPSGGLGMGGGGGANDTEGLPGPLGFIPLYLVSSLPVLIGVSVVGVLFWNSLS